jgi:hypothetical protein
MAVAWPRVSKVLPTATRTLPIASPKSTFGVEERGRMF